MDLSSLPEEFKSVFLNCCETRGPKTIWQRELVLPSLLVIPKVTNDVIEEIYSL